MAWSTHQRRRKEGVQTWDYVLCALHHGPKGSCHRRGSSPASPPGGYVSQPHPPIHPQSTGPQKQLNLAERVGLPKRRSPHTGSRPRRPAGPHLEGLCGVRHRAPTRYSPTSWTMWERGRYGLRLCGGTGLRVWFTHVSFVGLRSADCTAGSITL